MISAPNSRGRIVTLVAISIAIAPGSAVADWTARFDSGPGAVNHWTTLAPQDTTGVVVGGSGGAPGASGIVVRRYSSAGATSWSYTLAPHAPDADHVQAAAILPGCAVVGAG